MPGPEERAGKDMGYKPASWSFHSSGEDRPRIVQKTRAEQRGVGEERVRRWGEGGPALGYRCTGIMIWCLL